jgi:transcription antitermination factor NusG
MLVDLRSARRVWAVLAIKPRKEDVASAIFAREGYTTYTPKFRGPGSKEALRPLFPGYLFAWLSPTVDLPRARYFPTVLRPLLFGDLLAGVEEELVAHWRTREGGRGYLTPEPLPAFAVGQRVRFKEGVFAGLEGVVLENLASRERVRVLLDYLERSLPLEVDRGILS